MNVCFVRSCVRICVFGESKKRQTDCRMQGFHAGFRSFCLPLVLWYRVREGEQLRFKN